MYTDFRQNAVGFIAITNTVRIIVQTQLLLYTQQTRHEMNACRAVYAWVKRLYRNLWLQYHRHVDVGKHYIKSAVDLRKCL